MFLGIIHLFIGILRSTNLLVACQPIEISLSNESHKRNMTSLSISIPVVAEEVPILLDRGTVLRRVLCSIIRVKRVEGGLGRVVLMLLSSVGGLVTGVDTRVDLCVCLVVGKVTSSVE